MMTEYQVTLGAPEFLFGGAVGRGYTIIILKAENPERQKPGIESIAKDKGHRRRQQQKQRIQDLFPLWQAAPRIISILSSNRFMVFSGC